MTKDELVKKVTHIIAMGRAAEINSTYIAEDVIRALGLLDGTNMLIPGWRDISEAPKDGQCLVLTPEGQDISEYSEAEPDYPDQMGHDAGWWGMLTPADPGRSFGNPHYRREPTCQPTHFIPLSSIPTPPETEQGQ